MDAITEIARLITWVMHEYTLLAVTLIGYAFYKDKGTFPRLLTILLFSMILNTYLKSLWQIPLNSNLGTTGWAFPSGHMQGALVFWGWLAWELRQRSLYYVFSSLLIAFAWSMVYLGYHSWEDVVGGVVFGLLLLPCYHFFIKLLPPSRATLLPAFMALLGLPLMGMLPHSFAHLWMAQGALWGLSLGWTLLMRTPQAQLSDTKQALPSFFFSLFGLIIIYGLFSFLRPYMSASTLAFLKAFTLSFWVSYAAQAIVMRWVTVTSNDEVASAL